MTRLQVALDLTSLEEAIRVARLSAEAGVHILEAGTPLIKSEGIRAVKKLKELFPDKIVCADMKTMDAGRLEAELAVNAGADIVTVMALAADETIEEVCDAAHSVGAEVMVDLMNVTDILRRAEQVRDLGADYLCLHVGVDVQKKRGITAEDLAKEVKSLVDSGFKVAVAGGINKETAKIYSELNAEIVIVGKAIVASPDPARATREILEALVSR